MCHWYNDLDIKLSEYHFMLINPQEEILFYQINSAILETATSWQSIECISIFDYSAPVRSNH